MYELRIGAYKDFEDEFGYIHSTFLPRKGDIIDKYLIITEDLNDDEKTLKYYWTLEVQSVHFELFKDDSSMPIVYANVINEELVNND